MAIAEKINELIWKSSAKIREIIGDRICDIFLVFMIIGLYAIESVIPLGLVSRSGYYMFALIFLAIWLVYEKKTELKTLKDIGVFAVFLLGLVFFVSAIVFSDRSRAMEGICFMFLMPFGIFVLSGKENFERFMKVFGIASVIGFVLLMLVSWVVAPIFYFRYSSLLLNPNGLSKILIPMFVGTLITIARSVNEYKKIPLYCLLGIEAFYMIATRSRTGLLSIFGILVIWVCYALSRKAVDKKKKSKGIALIGVVAMVVCVAVTPSIHSSVSRLYVQSQLNAKGEATFLDVTRKNITEKITITDISYLTDKQATNAITVIAGTTTRLEKYAVEDVDISAGRFTIWKSAVKALNLKGHSSTEEFPVPGRQKIKTTNDPHNAFLSIGFKTGYVGLIAVLFVAVIVAIRCIVIIAGAIKKKELSYKEAITLSFGYSYLLIGMLAGSYLPISEVVAAMFWLTIPVSQRKEKEV